MKKYDSYKDSGIEWIGEIPEHWTIATIGRLTNLGRGRVISAIEIAENEGEFPVYSSQTENNGIMGCLNSFDFEGEYVTWTTDGANAGTVFYREGKFNCTNVCGTIQPKNWEQIELKFLPYYLNLGTKFSVRLDINPKLMNNMMAKIPLVIPPKTEQTAIAAYLDRKTAEIDELIADKKRLLEFYEEEKTAIINQAVTKGINPDVPMKDSGIEWLGEIPEHWDLKKIGHCGKIVRGGSPRPTGDPRYFFGDYIHWITVKEVTNAVGKYVVGTEEYLTEEGSKNSRIIEPETLLLSNSGATLGVPKISKIRGCINDGSVAFPELKPFLNRDYLYYFFVSHTDIYREQMAGNGQPNLNTEIIKSTFIPIPSTIEEQLAIVEFIESETEKVSSKKDKTEKLIELLTEYRTALISEVVTGKIKVTE